MKRCRWLCASLPGAFPMTLPPSRVGYILYVDESGDDGLDTVRPIDPNGASEWMILSGVLVHAHYAAKPIQWVREFKSTIKGSQRPDLHFADLTDPQRLSACEHFASKHLRWLAVVSNKRNMRGYQNARAAKRDTRNPFYNWMLRLLLERASQFCAERSVRDYGEMRAMRIELGARGGVSLPRIKVYLFEILRRQSAANTLYLQRGDIAWKVMNPDELAVFQARSRAGIQIADVVASGLRQAVDVKPDSRTDPRYALALRPTVASNRRGAVADFGLKLMPDPPDLWRVGLIESQISLFESFGYSRKHLVGPDP